MSRLYCIRNIGCDDETCGSFDLTEDQAEFLSKFFSALNKNSEYNCMPVIKIKDMHGVICEFSGFPCDKILSFESEVTE